jgi:hypothetical protein
MPDLLATGTAWLADRLAAYASHVVSYVRGAERLTLSATFGRTPMEVADGLGAVRVEYTGRDFLIRSENLILGGTYAEPARGDRIEELVGEKTHVYEVMHPDPGQQPFRYCDPSRKLMRVHTKLVSVT